jgi:RNA polymerase sigma-70 factor (ECF subfamily)
MTAAVLAARVPPDADATLVADATARVETAAMSFEELYADNLDVVWRGLRGLGVEEASIEDAVQDVFLVVHRKLGEFEAHSSPRTWLFGIVVRIARNHRRRFRRKGSRESGDLPMEMAAESPAPDEEAATAQALRRLARLLSGLDEAKREVFVLAELEQMSAPDIAETIGINVNTVYSRLRAARLAFNALVAREKRGRK